MSRRQFRGRQEFGARLRRLRLEAGLTGTGLAEVLGWAQSKVSRIETGKQTTTTTTTTGDVRAWAAAVRAPPGLVEDLVADLRSLRVEHAAWHRQLRTGHAPRQRALIALEAAARLDRTFQPLFIPGLLQTAEYARYVLTGLTRLRETPNDVELAVRLRMKRQEVLYDPDKRFRFLLTEAALRNLVGPAATQRRQLDRLLMLGGLDTVELAVIPFGIQLPVVMHHAFSIEDEDLVLVETFSAELSLRDRDDVALYGQVFELLWDVAHHGEAAIEIVTRVIRGLQAVEGRQ